MFRSFNVVLALDAHLATCNAANGICTDHFSKHVRNVRWTIKGRCRQQYQHRQNEKAEDILPCLFLFSAPLMLCVVFCPGSSSGESEKPGTQNLIFRIF